VVAQEEVQNNCLALVHLAVQVAVVQEQTVLVLGQVQQVVQEHLGKVTQVVMKTQQIVLAQGAVVLVQ
jgi:uracil-DNA glycosylase